MNDEFLLDIAITCAIIGLIAIFLISRFGNYSTELEPGTKTMLNGRIIDVKDYGSGSVLKVVHECYVDVEIGENIIVGDQYNTTLDQRVKSMNITAFGMVNEYGGKTKIIAEKILIG